jgi:large subunit ribosomal protein L15
MSGINELKPNPGSTRPRKRVGRGMGSGTGKTSGRGHKGQKSRSGAHSKRGFEGGQMPLHRRLPKRGFTNAVFKKHHSVINVGDLARLPDIEDGARIGPEELVAAGIVRKLKKDGLRVLGGGVIERPLHVVAQHFTKGAQEKISAAGGKCEVPEK